MFHGIFGGLFKLISIFSLLVWRPDDGMTNSIEEMNGSMESMGLDTSHDSQRLHRADSNHSVNSTVSADSRDHKIPRTSQLINLVSVWTFMHKIFSINNFIDFIFKL